MEKSKVYFTSFRCKVGVSQLDKLRKLLTAAGMGKIDFQDKFTAIKIHFGEPGNLAYPTMQKSSQIWFVRWAAVPS